MSDLTTLYAGKYIHMVRRGTWEFAHRPNVSGIVGIVAVTDDQKLILVEQFRTPLNCNVIEIPAGLAGDTAGCESEDLATAAARELEEETGYRARHIEFLCRGPSSAGLCDEIITLFRATGLEKTGAGGGHDGENITVHQIPLTELRRWLDKQANAGKSIDLKIYAALSFTIA